tara:strand:- start:6130 stop:6384 length:255 start_codon:yes stop_codon:yes gene_type:complete
MNEDNTYNGWHNYATWRVNLEIFDGMEIEEEWTWEYCRDYVEEILQQECDHSGTLVLSYALAFINDVAWAEIAEHLNEQLKEEE